MTERPHWRILNDGEEPPAGRVARDLPDGARVWCDDLDDEDEALDPEQPRTADLHAIAELRARLWHECGYRAVPLLSANDPDPKRAGKAPIHKDWTNRARRNPPEAANTPALAHIASTGILCDGLRVIDADIDNASLAEAVEELAIEHFGPVPTRRRSNSSRFAMLYRAAEGEPRKIVLVGAGHTDDHACKIEVLGKGLQFVAYGGHVSGGTLSWTVEPLDMPRDQLAAVTEPQITAFLAAVAPVIGAEAPAKRKPQTTMGSNGGAGPALAQLEAALALIPAEAADDYDTWIRVGAALHHESQGSAEGMAAWEEWAAKSSKFDAVETEERWSSFAEGGDGAKVSAATIFHLAKPYGWHPPDPADDPGYIAALEADALAEAARTARTPHDHGDGQDTAPAGSAGAFGQNEGDGEYGRADAKPTPGAGAKQEPSPEPAGEVQIVRGTIRPIATIPPRQWAYGKFLLFGSAACIGGMDGAGKGMLATAMALAMITGYPLLGEKVWRTGPVVIITYEDNQEEWERRIAAACLHFGLDYETLIGSFYFLHKPGGRVTLAERTRDNGLLFPDTARIVHFLKKIDAVKLIIDPFNSAHAMEDGNNNVAIAAVAQEITSIAQQAHVAALLLHHLRKGANGSVDDLMGAVALRANFRSVRILQVADEGTAIGLGIQVAEAWRYLWVAGTKENYAPPPLERMWFHKPSVSLNNPADIYIEGDEVGTIERWTPPPVFEGMDYPRMRAVFEAIATAPHAADRRAKAIPWAGKPLMDAGRTEEQAKKILDLWLQSKTLIEGPPFKTEQRREIKTLTIDPAKVAAILAQHAAPEKPQQPADD